MNYSHFYAVAEAKTYYSCSIRAFHINFILSFMNANLFVHSEKFYVRRVFNFPLLFRFMVVVVVVFFQFYFPQRKYK